MIYSWQNCHNSVSDNLSDNGIWRLLTLSLASTSAPDLSSD